MSAFKGKVDIVSMTCEVCYSPESAIGKIEIPHCGEP
jgi:hypothetical protein